MEEKFLKLTNAVYGILAYFPEADPLRNRAKDKALAIMDNLSLVFGTSGWVSLKTCLPAGREKVQSQLLDDIDMLLNYLKLGKLQGWLSPINYLIISNEYEKIKKKIALSPEFAERMTKINIPIILPERTQIVSDISTLSDRQKKIMKFLEENKKAQVMDLQTILPNITKRTIRRDLDELLKMGRIIRLGEFNQVFYRISGIQSS